MPNARDWFYRQSFNGRLEADERPGASRYMIRSRESGEVYVSDGAYACGPLDSAERNAPLGDYNLDNEAPDWVAAKDGIVEREL